jgi:chorismate-pyruvate lyase
MMQTTIEAPDRIKAHALLRALNAELLSHDSATLTLERWCEARGLASPARIVAERRHGSHVEPSVEQRRLLGVGTSDLIRYRRVRLRCGDCVVSEADNWYVPARLTAAMNRELDTTDVAFGRAVRSLNFRRRTLSSRLLWSALLPAEGADEGLGAELARPVIPPQVLVHTAVLTLPDGTPFSFLVETYAREVLALRSRHWPSEAAAANDSIVRVRRRRWRLSQGYTEPIA